MRRHQPSAALLYHDVAFALQVPSHPENAVERRLKKPFDDHHREVEVYGRLAHQFVVSRLQRNRQQATFHQARVVIIGHHAPNLPV